MPLFYINSFISDGWFPALLPESRTYEKFASNSNRRGEFFFAFGWQEKIGTHNNIKTMKGVGF